jgi:hypothetical protein
VPFRLDRSISKLETFRYGDAQWNEGFPRPTLLNEGWPPSASILTGQADMMSAIRNSADGDIYRKRLIEV